MKKFSILLTILATFAVASSAWAAQPIGKVLAIRGAVQAVQMNGVVRDELSLSAPVFANEKIVTGEGAKVQVVFEDKSLFTLGANSEVLLDKYVYDPQTGDGESVLEVTKGVFKFLTGKIAKADPDKVKVNTPYATIGVRGSGGIVQVDPKGQTTLNMTECCLNIGARGSNSAPVELKQVNTFSRVSADGQVSQPQPAPMNMLMEMNSQIDLGDAEKAEGVEGDAAADKPKQKASLKEMVKEKSEANAESSEGEVLAKKPAPAPEGSLLAAFGSDAGDVDRAEGETVIPVTPDQPAPVTNVTDSQQDQTTGDIINGGGSIADQLTGAVRGRWLNDVDGNGVDDPRGEAVVVLESSTNSIVLERKDANGDIVSSRVLTGAPAPNTAKAFSDVGVGGASFVYRSYQDKFFYVGTQPNNISGAGNYKMVVGHEGAIDATNQIVDGERYFFKFIPDYNLGESQVVNFAYPDGVNGMGKGDGLAMVVDYTNNNRQFLAGAAKFGSDNFGNYSSSLRFTAGVMNQGSSMSSLMTGTVYSFDNNSADGFASNEGFTTSTAGSAYGTSPDDIAAYQMKFVSMDAGNEQTVYAVRDPNMNPTAPVNPTDTAQELVGYSAGFYVEQVGSAGQTAHVMANQDKNFATIDRMDDSTGGIALDGDFKYYRMDESTGELKTGSADDTFRIGFGGSTAERAYVGHNAYGAETSYDPADYSIGANFGDSYAGTSYASTDGAMISSAFVELPSNAGIQEDCKSCDFVTWGVWAADIELASGEVGIGQLVPYVVGDINHVKTWGEIEANGVTSANYKGVLVGGISDGTKVVNEAGSFNMDVDFANRNINFVGDIGDYKMYADETNVNTAGGVGFTGVSFDTIKHKNVAVSGSGQINGAFYGDQAQEVGGNFYMQDYTNSNSAAGIMAGKKQ